MDEASAVPRFVAAKRQHIDLPLLSPGASSSAIKWSTQSHPARSGVEPEVIIASLADYVDAAAVRQAIAAYNSANPADQIAAGTGPIDAVFVESVHQFQKKCFLEDGQHDGKAGESTLDTLGLVDRSRLHTWNKVNATARRRLKRAGSAVARATDGEFNAENWFRHMANPAVFGLTFNRGIHLVLLRKLRAAERHLLTLPAYEAMTPAELGRTLGLNEKHKGSRPAAKTGSMHTFGLAIDIGYRANPWVRKTSSRDAIRHAALLTGGVSLSQRRITQEFHALGNNPALPSDAVYDGVADLDGALREYLGFEADNAALAAATRSRVAAGTGGIVKGSESESDAARRWAGQIKKDRKKLAANDFRGHHAPAGGFLNLPRDLVVALRDHGCLAWGGADIGGGTFGSGDIMHFDARSEGVGRLLARTSAALVRGNFVPPERQCVSVAAVQPNDTAPDADATAPPERPTGSILNKAKLERAVRRNPIHAERLGWASSRDMIARLVTGGGAALSDEDFANAVAAWQRQEGLEVDGIVGRITWSRIRDVTGHR